MGRFSFSPPGRESVEVAERSWREYDDSTSSINDEGDDESSIDSLSVSSDEEEYPHPLGFPSYGKTRFFLDPPIESAQQVRRRLGFLKEQDDFLEMNGDWQHGAMQSFPPLSSYVDPKTAPTEALLSYSYYNERPEEEEDPLEGVTQLLRAARIVEDDSPQYARLLSETQQAGQHLLAMSKTTEYELASARQDMSQRRRQLEKEHQETHEAFLLILKRDQQAADKVLKQQEAEARAREEADQARRDQEEKDEAERQRIADERQKKEQAKQQRAVQAAQKRDEELKAAAQEEAKKTEYITKAEKRVAQLVQLRASVAPFETSKNVSRRRLKMKKIVKGKVNTLNQDAHKIQTVASEVTQAINQAREEDDQLKQQARAGNRDITEEMLRGKRYLVDLLASDTMVRAQAEGFNGTRGDGFLLANMLAMVSTQVKELLPILSAHIYTVCPTAIPTLPKVTKNESEKELMESLGMAKGSDGEYETFDRFLARTEGIISLVADIMASNPPEHVLMGGHKGAIEWLERFLGLLPPSPEEMPLLTAPVLDAFLTGAGHMLANKYPEEFKKHLNVITTDIVNRLDEGPVGAPSALRLKKLVKGGFDSFKTDFPSKAIPSLYNGGASGAPASSSFGQSTTTTQATSSLPPPAPNPFGGGQQQGSSSGPASNPFGGGQQQGSSSAPLTSGGSSTSTTSNPFGAPSSGPAANPPASGGSGGGGGGFASSSTPAAHTPFGASATPVAQTPFGASAPAPAPFGQQPSTSTQPASSFGGGGFGQQQQPTSSFGQQQQQSSFGSGGTSSNATPFGQQSSVPIGPFGGQNQSNTMQPGFGGGGANVNASPFGQSSSGASPFPSQNQLTMQTSSNPSPFGQQSGSSGFGGQNQGMGMTKSPFGSVSNPFGAPSGQSSTGSAFGTSKTPFGSSQNTPFGSQSTPFGGKQNATFGSNQNTPFGAGQQQSGGPFGGGGGNRNAGKPPCKFFAQGKCRFGNNCRFSHETPGGGGFNNNPFGGPRR